MSKSENEKKGEGIEKYQDPTGVTVKKMERAFWFFKHRKDFKTAIIFFLILLGVILWGYALYGAGKYLVVGMNNDKKLFDKLVNSNRASLQAIRATAPENLKYSSLEVIKDGGKYDLVMQIENPNKRHYAKFDYCFYDGDREINCGQNFIFPGESKYILSLSREIGLNSASVKFDTTNVNWSKIDRHEIPDWDKFKSSRMDFSIKDKEITPAEKTKLSEELNLSDVSFSIVNKSGYGYYKVPLNIVLVSGSKIVAVNKYTINNFYSKQQKNINITWPNLNFSGGKINIYPEVNLLDDSVYMNIKGG